MHQYIGQSMTKGIFNEETLRRYYESTLGNSSRVRLVGMYLQPYLADIKKFLEKGYSLKACYGCLREQGLISDKIPLLAFYRFCKSHNIRSDIGLHNNIESEKQNLKDHLLTRQVKSDKGNQTNRITDDRNKITNVAEIKTFKGNKSNSQKKYVGNKDDEIQVCIDNKYRPFVHVPEKLYRLRNTDELYPKYFSSRFKLERIFPNSLVPWALGGDDLLISEDWELYVPKNQMPLMMSLCLKKGSLRSYDTHIYCSVDDYPEKIISVFHSQEKPEKIHGRNILMTY